MTPRDFLFLPPVPADERIAYGPEALHFGELRIPRTAGPHPMVLAVHGGFWRNTRDLTHMGRLCAALAAHGIASFSIEYRRIGDPGGGWPGTYEDVGRAAEWLRARVGEFAVLGFSAGGHLALRMAADLRWLRGVVALAPVADLEAAWDLDLGDGATREFLSGERDLLTAASPVLHALRAPVRIVHGDADEIVPLSLSRTYAAAWPCRLQVVEGANHFDLVNPESVAWPAVLAAVFCKES